MTWKEVFCRTLVQKTNPDRVVGGEAGRIFNLPLTFLELIIATFGIQKQENIMKIIIIGATGNLAKPVVSHMAKQGYELRLFSRSVKPSMFEGKQESIQGDLFNLSGLEKAIEGCDGIHINLSNLDEGEAARVIVAAAKKKGIKTISFISGSTVSEENRYFEMMDRKFRAEQELMNSGIDYMIFRPSWFYESLPWMVRNGKAMMMGKQPMLFHWAAADDLGRMVATAYSKPEALNKIFYIHGPKAYLFKDILAEYCKKRHPEIKKITATPFSVLKIIGFITGNRMLMDAVKMFQYFEKTRELGDPTEANELLGKPEITLEKWMENQSASQGVFF